MYEQFCKFDECISQTVIKVISKFIVIDYTVIWKYPPLAASELMQYGRGPYSVTSLSAGKVFPKLRRKGSRLSNLSSGSQTSDSSSSVSIDDAASLQTEEEETTDYVFRIITTFRPDNIRECLRVVSALWVDCVRDRWMEK